MCYISRRIKQDLIPSCYSIHELCQLNCATSSNLFPTRIEVNIIVPKLKRQQQNTLYISTCVNHLLPLLTHLIMEVQEQVSDDELPVISRYEISRAGGQQRLHQTPPGLQRISLGT